MEIKRNGSQASTKGNADWFTGGTSRRSCDGSDFGQKSLDGEMKRPAFVRSTLGPQPHHGGGRTGLGPVLPAPAEKSEVSHHFKQISLVSRSKGTISLPAVTSRALGAGARSSREVHRCAGGLFPPLSFRFSLLC
jgi:hypothetical protein